ncbi:MULTISPECIES: DsbA family protein [unclassified Streptomyces]|uniref:2-hydroxychromene-2-carboxylate isomerase n=1 Tax=unclassified Streptomyces TaxID=2593676 RepID=UPI000516894B|nr:MULTISPECIES: DsbA family protein [unclassified Streptomyces]MYX04949.1 2-hydroxychromene-2-carboxylate isomerase [Streptomyces sp. SID8378]PVC99864.1 isomerase [Streptomyces sp. CS147]SNB89538.1 2-hydroxychromene-2-carboxylate isomerase [Streptomyces sp. PgraA7]
MPKNTKPRFYFNLRSPYSWLAHREVMERHPDLASQLEWVPFFEPDPLSARMLSEHGGTFPYSEMSREKNRYVLQDVGRLTKARGLSVKWPVDRKPVWEVPHLGYLVAERMGRGHEYITAVYAARFGEGRDICDRATIADVGARIGIDSEVIANACDDPELRAEGVRILLDVCKDGVFGVPFFVHGYTRFWGIDRLDAFVAHLDSRGVPATTVPEPSAAVGLGRSTDDAHAGGCG